MKKSDCYLHNLEWFNTVEAAEYLRLSVSSLRSMLCRGTIPRYKLGKSLRFKKADLDELLESSKTTGDLYGN